MKNRDFFNRGADKVAKALLGCEIHRNIGGWLLKGKIIETEAYFDEKDPASRACQKGDIRDTMRMNPGTILVYGVHNNWLVNFVTDEEGVASAVLIRGIEPLNFRGNCCGPGRVCRHLHIDKDHHKKELGEEIKIKIKKKRYLIGKSFRIGVRKDLKKPMRFYIKK